MITLNSSNGHYHATVEPGDTHQLSRILTKHLPQVMDRFARKNRQYGENPFELGAAGQFPEIWRKVNRLRALLWDGPRGGFTEFEDAEEVIGDMIGHLLMLLDCLDDSRTGGYKGPVPPMAMTTNESGQVRPARVGDDVVGHLIRESKAGPETWVDPGVGENDWSREQRLGAVTSSTTETDDDGVKRYPVGFKGRHSYLVGEVLKVPDGLGRLMMTAHGHTIRVAFNEEPRCGWRLGDPAQPSGDNQCVGIEGHGLDFARNENYHINKDLEAWPV